MMAMEGLNSAEISDRALDAQRIFELTNSTYFFVCFAESGRKGQIAQNGSFELLGRHRKCNAHI
jgi:hypothetical protein